MKQNFNKKDEKKNQTKQIFPSQNFGQVKYKIVDEKVWNELLKKSTGGRRIR